MTPWVGQQISVGNHSNTSTNEMASTPHTSMLHGD
jgi:hypothetical protein